MSNVAFLAKLSEVCKMYPAIDTFITSAGTVLQAGYLLYTGTPTDALLHRALRSARATSARPASGGSLLLISAVQACYANLPPTASVTSVPARPSFSPPATSPPSPTRLAVPPLSTPAHDRPAATPPPDLLTPEPGDASDVPDLATTSDHDDVTIIADHDDAPAAASPATDAAPSAGATPSPDDAPSTAPYRPHQVHEPPADDRNKEYKQIPWLLENARGALAVTLCGWKQDSTLANTLCAESHGDGILMLAAIKNHVRANMVGDAAVLGLNMAKSRLFGKPFAPPAGGAAFTFDRRWHECVEYTSLVPDYDNAGTQITILKEFIVRLEPQYGTRVL